MRWVFQPEKAKKAEKAKQKHRYMEELAHAKRK
jgi:hypothetical protein